MAWDFNAYAQGVLRRAGIVVQPIINNPAGFVMAPNKYIANSFNLARQDLGSSSLQPINSIASRAFFPSSSVSSPSIVSSISRSSRSSRFSKSFSYSRYKKFSGGIVLYW